MKRRWFALGARPGRVQRKKRRSFPGMMQSYSDYNLHLAFANKNGEFLADVRLAIRDADGMVVLRALSDRPYYFARLPEGNYEVAAEFGGATRTRSVRVGAQPGPIHYFH